MKALTKLYVASLRLLANHCLIPQLRHRLFKLSGLRFGSKTYINMGLTIIDDYDNLVEIGSYVALSPNISLVASSTPNNSCLAQGARYTKKSPIYIGDHTWVGTGAVVLPGITIGKMAIIGANAVVVTDVNDYEIVAGVPAKVIGSTYQIPT